MLSGLWSGSFFLMETCSVMADADWIKAARTGNGSLNGAQTFLTLHMGKRNERNYLA